MEDWSLGNPLWGVTRQRLDNFRWQLVVVYGPTQHEFSISFLTELGSFLQSAVLPCLVGGDFNLIRTLSDKSSGRGDKHLMDAFNSFIEQHSLRELTRLGARYTWNNKQDRPIQSNIDRVFMTTEWEMKFPLSILSSLTRLGSDHCPLLLGNGETVEVRLEAVSLREAMVAAGGSHEESGR